MEKNNKAHLITFQAREELAANLAAKISRLLQEAVAARNRAVLVVSGGATPKPLFIRLAQKDLPWQRVTVTLADERWVDPAHPESNENLVRTYLLRDRAETANFIGLKNGYPTAAAGEKKCRERLNRLARPFDVVVLGMGHDGHTASLLPGSPQLKSALDLGNPSPCMAITPANAAMERMTMTLPALLDAGQIFLHITGNEKRCVLEQAQAGGAVEDMPVRGILLQEHTPVYTYWSP
ncbi:MAG: 6-phosphogluconolactonase [Desulfobulbaceae bacterium]|nr:6-phosphogluconolactonase [Desulfobulbaceae bacterium]